jgi:serine/threonine protein kinase
MASGNERGDGSDRRSTRAHGSGPDQASGWRGPGAAPGSLSPASGRLGPFELVRRLGTGGFAPVWLANEVYNNTVLRQAAVKLFAVRPAASVASPQLSNVHPSILAEAAALCRVEHPNVVRFYSLAGDESTTGVIGLAMEYVAGESLFQRLVARGRLSVSETLNVGLAVASALAAVHQAGLVHRDLKPANIVESEGISKLIDFGLATAESAIALQSRPLLHVQTMSSLQAHGREQMLARSSARPTGHAAPLSSFAGLVVQDGAGERTVTLATRCGTLGYIDPECMANGIPASPSSDLYALGVILFECLVGSPPAARELGSHGPHADLRGEVLLGRERAMSVSMLQPQVPQALAGLIESLLEPRRSARPASAEVVIERLERVRWLIEPRRTAAVAPANPHESAASVHASELGQVPRGWWPSAPPLPDEFRFDSGPLLYDGVALLTRGNAMLVVYQAPARFHRTRWVFDCADRLASRCPEGIVCLMIVLPTADPPDARTRAENARRFKKLGDTLRAMVTVPSGNSLWLNLVRSIMRGINAAQGTSSKFTVSDTIEQGISRLLESADTSLVQRPLLEAGVQALYGALGATPQG